MCQDVRDSCDVADNGDICGGRVLRCLSTKMDDIKSPSCKWVASLNIGVLAHVCTRAAGGLVV